MYCNTCGFQRTYNAPASTLECPRCGQALTGPWEEADFLKNYSHRLNIEIGIVKPAEPKFDKLKFFSHFCLGVFVWIFCMMIPLSGLFATFLPGASFQSLAPWILLSASIFGIFPGIIGDRFWNGQYSG